MRDYHWKLRQSGEAFHNGKGTAREVIEVTGRTGSSGRYQSTQHWKVHWKKVAGKGRLKGTITWQSWLNWVKGEWVPPRPERLPVPDVNEVEFVFPTNKHAPPWHWVGDEFKQEPCYYDHTNPWCKVVESLVFNKKSWTDWYSLPKDGVDGEKAWRALCETLGSWGMRVEAKVATVAYMMSEWFEDCWFDGDTHSRIHNHTLAEWIEGWPQGD